MSVPNQIPYIIYNANGLTTVFPFEFYIISASDIQVTLNGETVTSGYSVSGVGNVSGGDIIFLTPPVSGTVVMLERVVPTYRLTDYQDNGDLLADTVNKDFDRLWMAIQRSFIYLGLALRRPLFGGPFDAQGYRISKGGDPVDKQDFATKNYVDNVSLVRALRVPEAFVAPLPPVEQRKNKIVAMDNSGNPLMVLPESGSAADVMIELAKPSGAGGIGTTSGETVQQELDDRAADISALGARASALEYDAFVSSSDAMMRAAQIIRSYLKSASNKLVTIIGDSISHGASAGGSLYLNGWVNIFKRCFNNEFQTYSYGYAPTTSISGWREVHEVAFLPNSASWTGKEGQDGADIQQGLSFTTTDVGASQRVVVPTFQGRCLIHYVKRPDGATATISVNGTVVQNVSTNGSYDVTPIFVVPMTDSKGICTIEIANTNGGALEIMGYSFISNASDEIKLMNYSISGRRLAYMSTVAMDAIFNEAAMVIMALGYNDSSFVNSDPAYAATFKTKIDYLISKSLAKGVPLVVPDFCWDSAPDSEVRKQLKRLAQATSGLYIPFPDFFNIGRSITNNDFRVNTLKLFVDGAHPNINGHKLIAEAMAKAMQLSVTSKEQALRYHDWWYPLQLSNTGVGNKTTSYDTISAARWQGRHVVLRYSLTGIPGSTAREVQSAWPVKSGLVNAQVNLITLSLKTDGTNNGTINVAAGGLITASPSLSNATSEHSGSAIII